MPNNFIPIEIQSENDSISIEGKSHYKKISWPFEFTQVSTTKETDKIIQSSNSSVLFFSEAIKNGYSVSSITAGTQRTYSNFGNSSSTSTVSALYEHIRGYVYRNFGVSADQYWNTYLVTSAGVSGLIVSKSTTAGPPCLPNTTPGSLTSIRVMFLNRSFFGDRIKPGTYKLNIRPLFANFSDQAGLDFPNENISDMYASGGYLSVTGQAGLTGSLSAGVSGSMLTGFSILMRIKPSRSGPSIQSLFHRRSGDFSQSAVSYLVSTNNSIVQQKYSDTFPLSASISPLTISYSLTTGSPTTSDIKSLTSVLKITNRGGGRLFWSVSATNSKTNTDADQPTIGLSVSSALTTGTIYGITNLLSTTASITAFFTNSATGMFYEPVEGSYGGTISIFNTPTSYERSANLPIIVPVTVNFTL